MQHVCAEGEAVTGHVCGDGRHDEAAAADYLGVQPATLRAWRSRRQGPPFIRAGRIWYLREDLDVWIMSRRIDPADADA